MAINIFADSVKTSTMQKDLEAVVVRISRVGGKKIIQKKTEHMLRFIGLENLVNLQRTCIVFSVQKKQLMHTMTITVDRLMLNGYAKVVIENCTTVLCFLHAHTDNHALNLKPQKQAR